MNVLLDVIYWTKMAKLCVVHLDRNGGITEHWKAVKRIRSGS